MKPAFSACLLVVVFPAILAAQETPEGIPAGYVQTDTAGRIRLFARAKDAVPFAVKDPLLKELKTLDKNFRTAFLLDRARVRPGRQEGAIFGGPERKSVALILFDVEADFAAWQKAALMSIDPLDPDAYRGIVAARLTDGALNPEAMRGLRRDLARTYLRHLLYLGQPIWLVDGLSRHYECLAGPKGELDSEAVDALLGSLKEAMKNKGCAPVDQLLLRPTAEFTKESSAEAWALVRLLTLHAPGVIPALLESLAALDAAAWSDPGLVGQDLRRYSLHLLGEAFGGGNRLQGAYDGFVTALLRGPAAPFKITGVPRLAAQAPDCELELKADLKQFRIRPGPGGIKVGNFAYGKVRTRVPWNVQMRMLCRYRDFKEVWGGEHDLNCTLELTPGQEAKYEDKRQTPESDFAGATLLVVIAEWRISGGGVYRTVRSKPVN